MAEILVGYYSRSGNVRRMAEEVAVGVEAAGGRCEVRPVQDLSATDLLHYDGIALGSPTYYGLPAAEVVRFVDESVSLHGRLEGKVGAAFSSSANIGGGNESTCLALLQMMLVHGMLVMGAAKGDHYGPVSIGMPDERVFDQCRTLGDRLARTAQMVRVG